MAVYHALIERIPPTLDRTQSPRYRVLYAGEVLVDDCERPECEACRALFARGITGRIQFQLKGCAPGLTMDVEAGARQTSSDIPDRGRGAQLDTYSSIAEAEADKVQQQRLLAALNAWDRALGRDECGAWTLAGEHGSIHTWGDGKGWVLYIACRSARHWAATKAWLNFCQVTQDGEDEGCVRLSKLPTAEQAEVIRDCLGIRKRRDLSEESLDQLRHMRVKSAKQAGATGSPSTEAT
jgi:hypothetical protein